MAVADEPEPFWDGTGHEAVLERVTRRVPVKAGTLRAAGEHNGRAGRTLKEDYLDPLGLTRDDVYIADIQNYYLAAPVGYQTGETPSAVTERLMTRIRALVDEIAREYPQRPRRPHERWWLPAHLGGTAPRPGEPATGGDLPTR